MFTEGSAVEVNFEGKGKWHAATVSKVHSDNSGRLDVEYDIGGE
jgi:hypothetical protein